MAVLGSPVRFTFLLILIFCLCMDSTSAIYRRRRRRQFQCYPTCSWSSWGTWSSCSQPCGNKGTRVRYRTGNCVGCGSTPSINTRSESEPCNQFCYNSGTPDPHGVGCICNLFYQGQCCDVDKPLDPCSKYMELNEGWRNVHQVNTGKEDQCDSGFAGEWYRFVEPAGTIMPTEAPASRHRCGADAPMWMNGRLPTLVDGVVSRQVCGVWDDSNCHWETTIQVRACHPGYFVYKLPAPPACSMIYCGKFWYSTNDSAINLNVNVQHISVNVWIGIGAGGGGLLILGILICICRKKCDCDDY